MTIRAVRVGTLLALALLFHAGAAAAQDYFVPTQQRAAPAPAARQARPAARPAPAPAPLPAPVPQPQDQADAEQPAQIPLPPVPDLPPLPKSAPPPAAVIGVIGVPEVMRASTSAQQVEKVIGERREKLNQDAQKEQSAWREIQQQLGNERGKLSADQARAREKELTDRINAAQRSFRERNRIIQEAAQVSLGQIERTLIGVIRQVAESHGMNLVLHRAQVALNVNEFDITDQVTEQLNKLLPSVTIPPDGVSPLAQQTPPAGAAPAPTSAQAAARPKN